MSSVAELLLQAASKLSSEPSTEDALRAAAASVESTPDLLEAIRLVRPRLRDQIEALESTQRQLRALNRAMGDLASVVRYTPDGWPAERDRIAGLLTRTPRAGVLAWIAFFYDAAAGYRLDAVGRLVADVELPASAGLLAARARNALEGLQQHDVTRALDMLRPGADLSAYRLSLADASTPQRFQLLLARLAIRENKLTLATALLDDAVLASAEPTGVRASVLACRAAVARAGGEPGDAASLLSAAQDLDRGNLDVVVELIRQAPAPEDAGDRQDAAQLAVDGLTSTGDIDATFGQLIDVPVEFWLALADRAERDERPTQAAESLARARLVADELDPPMLAEIGERQAAGVTGSDRLARCLEAGNHRVAALQYVQARADFDAGMRAGRADPGTDPDLLADVSRRHADMVSYLSAPQPLRVVKEDLELALDDVLAVAGAGDVSGTGSWSYLTEADLRSSLARTAGRPDRIEHRWRALLAAARGVALRPDAPIRWASLSDMTGNSYAPNASEAAARRRNELDPEPDAGLVVAAANLGRYDEVLRFSEDKTDPFWTTLRALSLLHTGRPDEAIGAFRAIDLDPGWTWAYNALFAALLLTGDVAGARAEATAFLATGTSRLDELDVLERCAQAAMIAGDLVAAREWAEIAVTAEGDLGDGEGLLLLAQVLMLSGDDRGPEVLAEAVARRTITGLDEWESIGERVLAVLAEGYGISLPVLELAAPIAIRRAVLESFSEPRAEIDAIPADGTDPEVVTAARALTRLALDLADSAADESGVDPTAALDAVAALGTFPDEVESVRRHLAERAAANVTEPAEPPEPEPVEVTPDVEPAEEAPVEVNLDLPGSWFAGHEDPVNDHVVFTRHLPQVRGRVAGSIPTVRITVDETLEPGGYEIRSGDQVLSRGETDPAMRYFDPAATALLPGVDGAVGTTAGTLGLAGVPEAAIDASDPVADLLGMDAAELVITHLADVVADHDAGPEPTV